MLEHSDSLPTGSAPKALIPAHFPTQYQTVIWRNWGQVTPQRLAQVLQCSASQVVESASAMGLDQPATVDHESLWLKRGYITLIRDNWHLLDYPQLLLLLGWSSKRFRDALMNEDFLWHKLGSLKPVAGEVVWSPLTQKQAEQTQSLRKTIEPLLATIGASAKEDPFAFINKFGQQLENKSTSGTSVKQPEAPLRLAYSYSAVYGDPLLDPSLDPYPDNMLADYQSQGVNGIWLPGILYSLVPWMGECEYSQGHEIRIEALNKLVARAKRFGIGVYLYFNEPRGMPPSFFKQHPHWAGARQTNGDAIGICLSNPDVLDALKTGIQTLFEQVDGLAGVFTITASENQTHCHSHSERENCVPCPRCASTPPWQMIATVNNAIAQAVHAAKPQAAVIAWDWSWNPEWSEQVIALLQQDVQLMSTSERHVATNAMGIVGKVEDYSISKIGPGPLAIRNWAAARKRGLKIIAKVQVNNTWECAFTPYIPVPWLVSEHLDRLANEKVDGMMLSWTLGGYPGGNMALLDRDPATIASALFGDEAAPAIMETWRCMGQAFTLFPINGCSVQYLSPHNVGPMNLLYEKSTGYVATMVGFPYDYLLGWRSNHFPQDVFETQFKKISEGWANGLKMLKDTAPHLTSEHSAAYADLINVAEACYCHFRSTYLQARYVRLRDDDSCSNRDEILSVLDEETDLAIRLATVAHRDSRIGYEAANHYAYTQQTLLEKVLNCKHLANSKFKSI